jgi:hypothetical protein
MITTTATLPDHATTPQVQIAPSSCALSSRFHRHASACTHARTRPFVCTNTHPGDRHTHASRTQALHMMHKTLTTHALPTPTQAHTPSPRSPPSHTHKLAAARTARPATPPAFGSRPRRSSPRGSARPLVYVVGCYRIVVWRNPNQPAREPDRQQDRQQHSKTAAPKGSEAEEGVSVQPTRNACQTMV